MFSKLQFSEILPISLPPLPRLQYFSIYVRNKFIVNTCVCKKAETRENVLYSESYELNQFITESLYLARAACGRHHCQRPHSGGKNAETE